MANKNRQESSENYRNLESDLLDRELDAALAKFAINEPRAGLEERILANLRAERRHAAEHSWWRWPAVVALVAAIVIVLSVAWKVWRPVQNVTTQRLPAIHANVNSGVRGANNGTTGMMSHSAPSKKQLDLHPVSHTAGRMVPAPKLDQFPSPHPLSAQEKILAKYITNYPEHAALIAQARTEELLRDSVEEMDETDGSGK